MVRRLRKSYGDARNSPRFIPAGLQLPLALAGVRTAPGSTATHEPGLLGPALAALIVTGLTQGRVGLAALASRLVLGSRPTWRFFAYSLSPLVFLGLAIAVSIALGAPLPPWSDFAVYSGLPPLGLPAIVLLVLLFNGFGEETGWRGFALEPLQARFGPVTGTLVLAALWAGWHAASSRSSRKKADTSERLRGPDLRYTIKACKG